MRWASEHVALLAALRGPESTELVRDTLCPWSTVEFVPRRCGDGTGRTLPVAQAMMKKKRRLFGYGPAGEEGAVNSQKETYFIGKGLILRGEISGVGDVQVEGEFEGRINLAGAVVIREGAKVQGDISATDIIVAGLVQGDIHASSRVELLPTCHLVGSVRSKVLTVQEGAAVKGNIRSEIPLSPAAEFAEIARLVQQERVSET